MCHRDGYITLHGCPVIGIIFSFDFSFRTPCPETKISRGSYFQLYMRKTQCGISDAGAVSFVGRIIQLNQKPDRGVR